MKVRAPGKLVLCGEYAVLEGTAACVAAVDRFAEVSVENGPAEVHALSRHAALRFDATGAHIDDEHVDFALVRALLATARARGVAVPAKMWRIDSAALSVGVAGGEKLGLGSSAAVAAAFGRVVLGEGAPAGDVFEFALDAHLLFSEGRGSGIDVAAASFGGVLRYQNRKATPLVTDWSGLDALCVYVGRSQSTRDFLSQTDLLKGRDRPAYDEAIARIDEATDRLAAALTQGAPDALMRAAQDAGAGMALLGERAGADIVSAPHRTVRAVAQKLGGGAKPSGAGGGDVALCFVPEGNRTPAIAALRDAGMTPLDLQLGAPGARTLS